MVLLSGVMKTLRPLWRLVARNTLPSRVTGSFRTGESVLMAPASTARGLRPLLHIDAAHRDGFRNAQPDTSRPHFIRLDERGRSCTSIGKTQPKLKLSHRSRTGDRSKVRSVYRRSRSVVVGKVKRIGSFRPEFELETFRQGEFTEDRKVNILVARSAEPISGRVAVDGRP